MSKLLVENDPSGGYVIGQGAKIRVGSLVSDGGVGAHGAAPAAQAAKINDPAGGATQDAEARTAINAIIDVLEANGLAASS